MSDITNRIDMLLMKKQLRRADLSRGTNINESLFRKWASGSCPSVENLQRVAEFLEVSIDFLATGKDASNYGIYTEQEKKLLDIFYKLDDRDRNSIITLAEGLLSQYSSMKGRNISDA